MQHYRLYYGDSAPEVFENIERESDIDALVLSIVIIDPFIPPGLGDFVADLTVQKNKTSFQAFLDCSLLPNCLCGIIESFLGTDLGAYHAIRMYFEEYYQQNFGVPRYDTTPLTVQNIDLAAENR